MKKKTKMTNIGDVFRIKINENLSCFGQLVCKGKTSISVIIYDYTSNEDNLDINIITKNKIIYYVNTVNLFLTNGKWEVIGNQPIPSNLNFPEYIIETLDGYKVLSHEGNIIRNATKNDINKLNFHNSYSPIIVEDAVKAKYFGEDWYPALDKIIYNE